MKPAPLVLVTLLLSSHVAQAEWVQSEGSYVFPSNVTEAEACAKADERARLAAISKITGETLSAEETQRCTDQGDEAQCAHNSAIWTTLGGKITKVIDRVQRTVTEMESYRRCVVQFQADVQVSQGVPDPSFTLGVTLNAAVYRNGESMVIRLKPSQPMFVQIFQWLPYEKDDAQISRLFPNSFDGQFRLTQAASVPSAEGSKHYDLKLTFPAAPPVSQKMVDEYLMVVATRTPVTFRDSYTLEDFQKLLAEIPRNDSRIIRRAYNIVRGSE